MSAVNQLTTEQLARGVAQINANIKQNAPESPQYHLDCIETSYACDKRPQVRIDGTKYYCEVVVKLYEERKKYGNDYKIKQGFEASHYYCHNDQCVNPDHLHFEDHRVNKSRLACRLYGMTMVGFVCPHLPCCGINEFTQIKL